MTLLAFPSLTDLSRGIDWTEKLRENIISPYMEVCHLRLPRLVLLDYILKYQTGRNRRHLVGR